MATKDWKYTDSNEWTNSKTGRIIQISSIYGKSVVSVLSKKTLLTLHQKVYSQRAHALLYAQGWMNNH